jgi:hypothetical protein
MSRTRIHLPLPSSVGLPAASNAPTAPRSSFISDLRRATRAIGSKCVLVGLAVFAAACGSDKNTGPSDISNNGNGGVTGFALTNNYTDLDIYYVYAWKCGAQASTHDLLGSQEVIAPGKSRTFEVGAGCYHLRIELATESSDATDVAEGEITVVEGKIDPVAVNPSGDNQGCAPDCVLE